MEDEKMRVIDMSSLPSELNPSPSPIHRAREILSPPMPENSCRWLPAKFFVAHFPWFFMFIIVATVYCMMTEIVPLALCIFVGVFACAVAIGLRIGIARVIDESDWELQQQELRHVVRRYRRHHNPRAFREIMRRVVLLSRLEIENESMEDTERGLSPEILSQLPVYRYKAAKGSLETQSELERDPKDFCAICMEMYKDKDEILIFTCCHQFHSICAQQWLSGSKECPVCKKEVTIDEEAYCVS
eukprot:TRINITY_DN3729_c0_g1_i3.p1 TRINITY_DN3729_c0_g1~~TRINITY_DN3729_c0_g1_i3.p1  ORF type:complete len:244 (-),score=32.81 TRINITY_DN3729_c0_g1_i3:161-892(-)